MKTTRKLFIFGLTFLALATSAHALTPREQLKQMVQQLQKTPNDNALREKIIKLGASVRPAIPDEAEKYEGRAKFAFKNAKSTADYADAAKEYEKAVLAAPWIPGYYSDLCTIYEKAGQYADAKRNCEIYVKTLVDRSQISETKQRIAGLEFGIEKAKAEPERAAVKFTEFLRTRNGAVYRSALLQSGGVFEAQIQDSNYTLPYSLNVYYVHYGRKELVAQRVHDVFHYRPDDDYWYSIIMSFPKNYCSNEASRILCYGKATFTLKDDTITITLGDKEMTSNAPFTGQSVILRR